jgi:hypothetical protein
MPKLKEDYRKDLAAQMVMCWLNVGCGGSRGGYRRKKEDTMAP